VTILIQSSHIITHTLLRPPSMHSHHHTPPAAATILMVEPLSICRPWPVRELAGVQPILLLHPFAPATVTSCCCCCCCWIGSRAGELLRLEPVTQNDKKSDTKMTNMSDMGDRTPGWKAVQARQPPAVECQLTSTCCIADAAISIFVINSLQDIETIGKVLSRCCHGSQHAHRCCC